MVANSKGNAFRSKAPLNEMTSYRNLRITAGLTPSSTRAKLQACFPVSSTQGALRVPPSSGRNHHFVAVCLSISRATFAVFPCSLASHSLNSETDRQKNLSPRSDRAITMSISSELKQQSSNESFSQRLASEPSHVASGAPSTNGFFKLQTPRGGGSRHPPGRAPAKEFGRRPQERYRKGRFRFQDRSYHRVRA